MRSAATPSLLPTGFAAGVTVRNTFLEFDAREGDLAPEGGIARQTSEPAKPFNRQLSEQTTAGSVAASAEREESSVYAFSDVPQFGDTMWFACGGGPSGGPFPMQLAMSHNMMQTASSSASGFWAGPYSASATSRCGMLPTMRFCPNCGGDLQPNSRFCPFCCCCLFQTFSGTRGAGAQSERPCWPGLATSSGGRTAAAAAGCAPGGDAGELSFVASLRRFRYIEAASADVERARAVCSAVAYGAMA